MKSRIFGFVVIVGIVLIPLAMFHPISRAQAALLPPDIDLDPNTSPIGRCTYPSVVGDVCHNPPDAADKTVMIVQQKPTCTWKEDPITGIGRWQCMSRSTYPFKYDLYYKPGPGYVRPMYEWFALGLKLAIPWLTAGPIQKETVDFTNPQFETDMGRACFYDDDTGSFSEKVLTEYAISKFYIPLPWVNSLVQNADILAQENSLRKRQNQYYEQSTEYIKRSALFACGHTWHGTDSYNGPITSTGEVRFDPYTVNATVADVGPDINVKSHVFITNSKRTGKIEQFAAYGPGVSADDLLEAPITQEEKDYYATTPGFIETFAPLGAKYYHPEEINGKVVDNPFIGAFDKNTTTTFLDKLVDNGYKYLCTTLFPSNLMPARCKSPPIPTPTPALDVCQVAAKYGIQCCMLKGEMQLETNGGTTMGSGSCSTSHGTFNCCNGNACGPAQVLCSQYDAFAGKDNLNLCSQPGAAELLARALHLKLCQAAGACDSYDWDTQGVKAMKFDIPDNINDIKSYTALGYFYGMSQGCVASACTQYRWGAGKSYCDAIQNYCVNGQILPDNKTMQFCAACNEEIIRGGQPPLTCN